MAPRNYSDKEKDILLAEWQEIRESLRYFYFTTFLERRRTIERELELVRLMTLHRPYADRGTRATFWLYKAVAMLWMSFGWVAASGYRGPSLRP